jgi:hypothetical protein
MERRTPTARMPAIFSLVHAPQLHPRCRYHVSGFSMDRSWKKRGSRRLWHWVRADVLFTKDRAPLISKSPKPNPKIRFLILLFAVQFTNYWIKCSYMQLLWSTDADLSVLPYEIVSEMGSHYNWLHTSGTYKRSNVIFYHWYTDYFPYTGNYLSGP